MVESPQIRIRVCPEIRAYQDYLPDDWSEAIVKQLPVGSALERLVLDLALSWRGASYTAQMPATSIKAMHAAALGRGKVVSPDSSIVSYSDGILAKLSQQVPELIDDRALRARVQTALVTVAADFRDRAAAVKDDFPIEPMWNEFFTDPPFHLSLWGSQRVAYVAFYNAYETFLIDCLKCGKGLLRLRITDKAEFNDALRTALGKDVSGPCWSHHEINIARLVRHALSHNGGRLTDDLKKQKHRIEVIDDELQIMPQDIHRMLNRLRAAVAEATALMLQNPKFLALDSGPGESAPVEED